MSGAAGIADDFGVLIGRLWAAADSAEVARVLGEGARKLVGADGITLVLRAGALCHYVDEDAIGPLWKGRYFPLESCISGWTMLQRQQVAIADVFKDARIPQDAYRPTFVKSLVMSPIRRRDPVGALGAYWRERREASEAELGALQALADASANAIARQRRSVSAADARILLAATPAAAAPLRQALAATADVHFADAPETALEAFRSRSPDLLVVGYHFDHARPYRLVRAVRELDPQVPILLVRALPLSGVDSRDAQIRDAYNALGVDQYLVLDEASVRRGESGNRAVLLAAVRELLDRAA